MNYKPEFHNAVAEEYNEAYKWYDERSEGLGKNSLHQLGKQWKKSKNNHSYLASVQRRSSEKQGRKEFLI